MTDSELFKLAGIKEINKAVPKKKRLCRDFPFISAAVLAVILFSCLFAEILMTKDPAYLDLSSCNTAPNKEFIFGTDSLGRDIYSDIWYGGRISILIGFLSTLISTSIAVIYGAVSGTAPKWLDDAMMRFTEIFLSIPSILLVIFIGAALGKSNILTLSFIIGITSWPSIAKVVRTEVLQIRQSEYVLASKCMGANFFHILKNHLAPNFISSIMFMVVMNIRSAISTESTLSFMGMGLPIEIISWGSMLSLAQKALMTESWWVIIIPGAFLIALLVSITNIGNYIRKNFNQVESNI